MGPHKINRARIVAARLGRLAYPARLGSTGVREAATTNLVFFRLYELGETACFANTRYQGALCCCAGVKLGWGIDAICGDCVFLNFSNNF